ncbi:ABC transporter substrate-binding protein [Caproiciproducens faecalis]|uniref:ABC transporter substrate-binding protein n=1 Tax=Caproiciproducens faecalis TaxID=2820301 RepID=A0ABS7DKB9_9FIRM|nr:ABC transporter substrate-binding protein [Caproiciproducens faecalis]MBW7571735.1 ABC transporter substrate-binding protein [Caproiciproducens faecalis]
MKKTLALLLSGLIALSATACSSSSPASSAAAGSQAASGAAEKKLKIGIVQLVEHPALDAAYKGFVDGLAKEGYVDGQNITLDYQNAQGEQANCQTIASKLVNDKSDLILAIATPAAQAVANTTKDIPILVTAVTDPADAKLVASNQKPGGNVSGTSDLTPVAEQMKLLKQLIPTAKKVAMLYCSSETNSKFQVEIAKKSAAELGLETVDATVSNSNEIQQVVQSLVGKVEAIYAPTDNMIAAGMATVSMVAQPAKLPIIVGESGMVDNGGLATYGINYYDLGLITAKQAVKILKDGAKPADMPIEYSTNCDLTINKEVAAKIGVTIPQELLDKAGAASTASK